jgi:hypothetical protein
MLKINGTGCNELASKYGIASSTVKKWRGVISLFAAKKLVVLG